MKFRHYLEQRIRVIFLNIVLFIFFGSFMFTLYDNFPLLLLMGGGWFIILLIYFMIDYSQLKHQYNKIERLVDDLDQKYLVHEIIEEPHLLEAKAYYYALKKGSKAMTDQVSEARRNSKEYQEYIESWVHEIKTPIAAISLLCDNTQNKELKQQVSKIDQLVEQVLFYARSDNTQNDYLIKETTLEEMIHQSLIDFKNLILGNHIHLEIHDLDQTVYTDEKWIHFILNQILSNAIKYMKDEPRELMIYSEKHKYNIDLVIKDSGIGIAPQELPRVFNAGYTGDDRKKEHATGMGLYISKKLCDRLNLALTIDSKLGEYTCVKITFPIGKVHQFNQES